MIRQQLDQSEIERRFVQSYWNDADACRRAAVKILTDRGEPIEPARIRAKVRQLFGWLYGFAIRN